MINLALRLNRDNDMLLIKNGTLIDGTGRSKFRADILISKDKIVKIGKIESRTENKIDVEGLIVSPGFIDIHDHSDSTLLTDGMAKSLIYQGVTTTVIGNCGYSLAPVNEDTLDILLGNWLFPLQNIEIRWRSFGEYLRQLEENKTALNVAALVGHGTVRIAVLSMEDRKPDGKELRRMKELVHNAMEDGAFGLSSGLAYPPGCFAETEEIIELCREVVKFNGIYTTHTRKEAFGYLDGIKEAIDIAEKTNVRTQISHIETHYPAWGEQEMALNLLDTARKQGLDVGCDVILYLWSATSLYTLIPKWVYEGGPEHIIKRMNNQEVRARIKEEILNSKPELTSSALAKDGKWDRIKILSCPKEPELEGKTIIQIADLKGKEPFEVVFDLLSLGVPFPSIMAQSHNEDDIRKVVRVDYSIIETDLYALSSSQRKKSASNHPRGFGTFPLLFRKYVRGETREELPEEEGIKILSIEKAVKKITSLPAITFGIKDRGLLKEEKFADLVIFDGEHIQDLATYKHPFLYPKGIEYVIINGKILIENGKHANITPGKILRKNV